MMAPELFTTENKTVEVFGYTSLVDVWSLGVTCHMYAQAAYDLVNIGSLFSMSNLKCDTTWDTFLRTGRTHSSSGSLQIAINEVIMNEVDERGAQYRGVAGLLLSMIVVDPVSRKS